MMISCLSTTLTAGLSGPRWLVRALSVVVGSVVVGDTDGDTVGSEVVGAAVGSEVVGDTDGDAVGSEMVSEGAKCGGRVRCGGRHRRRHGRI